MRLFGLMVLVGCGQSVSSIDDVSVVDSGGFGERCLSVAPKLLRLDAQTPAAPITLSGSCGFEQSVVVVLDDPSGVFEVDASQAETIDNDAVPIEVRLIATTPGSYQGLLSVSGDQETFRIELRGEITAQ
ncbi:MAG: hypothetical protein AB8H79_09655 [Myxococcota bacterium]